MPRVGQFRMLLCAAMVVIVAALISYWEVVKMPLVAMPYYTVALAYYGDTSLKTGWGDALYAGNLAMGQSALFAKPLPEPRWKSSPQDHISRVCQTSLFTKDAEEPTPFLHVYDVDRIIEPLSIEDRLEAYMQVCTQIYAGLDEKEKIVLDSMVDFPESDDVANVTQAWLNGPWNESDRHVHLERRETIANSRSSLESRWKPAEFYEKDLGPNVQICRSHGICPVEEEWIPAMGIGDAVRKGQVALFDATELLPSELFNMTLERLAALHENAAAIPFVRFGAHAVTRGWESLADLSQRMQAYNSKGLTWFPELKPWADSEGEGVEDFVRRLKAAEPWWLRLYTLMAGKLLNQDIYPNLKNLLQYLMITYGAGSRMQDLPKPKVDLKKVLGSDWIEDLWTNVWVGPHKGGMHFDEPDNILIGLNGIVYVTVYPQPDVHLVAEMRQPRRVGLDNPTNIKWIQDPNNSWAQKFPFYTVKLEPGTGVVIPSRSYHYVHSPDANRMLYNVWMMEKFNSTILDEPTGQYRFGKRGSQADTHLALRHLKHSTLFTLWKTKKVGGFFMGHMELI
mmetsp:Transcript_48210/g.84806  ORF Transcript_48210/g.84806 Transcript_48210/m.84806 type:complete len:566 (+) Transcript_48210:132-1829(+)